MFFPSIFSHLVKNNPVFGRNSVPIGSNGGQKVPIRRPVFAPPADVTLSSRSAHHEESLRGPQLPYRSPNFREVIGNLNASCTPPHALLRIGRAEGKRWMCTWEFVVWS